MMDAWAKAEALTKAALESGGIFLRLANDGDKTVVAFCDEPYAHDVHWTGTAYEACEGQGCQHCTSGLRASLRVAFNVFVVADGAMKIMEGGARWFTDILKVRNKYGLDNYAFEIERHGAAGSPKTTYSILPDVPLDSELRLKIAGVKRHDLRSEDVQQTVAREASAPVAPSATHPNAQGDAEEAFVQPIEIGLAREIHMQLRRMDKSDVDGFMSHFGITKVTDLKARDENPARQFLQERTLLL